MINVANWIRHQLANDDDYIVEGRPMMSPPPEDIVWWIQANFAEDEREAAFTCVFRLLEGLHPIASHMLRCLCILSEGRLKKLDWAIDLMHTDWRDVIAMAEYVERDGERVKVRDLTKPLTDPVNVTELKRTLSL